MQSALAAAFIGRFIHAQEQRTTVSLRAESKALRQGRLWLALTYAMLIMGGVMATYTCIPPLLTERTGIPEGAIPLVLIAFGIGALAGPELRARRDVTFFLGGPGRSQPGAAARRSSGMQVGRWRGLFLRGRRGPGATGGPVRTRRATATWSSG
jgi:hypothetical protein